MAPGTPMGFIPSSDPGSARAASYFSRKMSGDVRTLKTHIRKMTRPDDPILRCHCFITAATRLSASSTAWRGWSTDAVWMVLQRDQRARTVTKSTDSRGTHTPAYIELGIAIADALDAGQTFRNCSTGKGFGWSRRGHQIGHEEVLLDRIRAGGFS